MNGYYGDLDWKIYFEDNKLVFIDCNGGKTLLEIINPYFDKNKVQKHEVDVLTEWLWPGGDLPEQLADDEMKASIHHWLDKYTK